MDKRLQEKIRTAMRSTFVGDVVFRPDEWEIALKELRIPLFDACLHDDIRFDPHYNNLLFVVLVNLTKSWDSSDGAWTDYLAKTLLKEASSHEKPRRKFYKILRDSLSFIFENYANVFNFGNEEKAERNQRFYTTVTSHAFAPKDSFMAFFEMVWDFYLDTLEQEYVDNDPLLTMFSDRLKEKIVGNAIDDENIHLGSENYALRASIKKLVVHKEEIFLKLLNRVANAIHTLFNDGNLDRASYLNQLIIEWWTMKRDSFGEVKERKKGGRTARSYAEIKARYYMDNGKVIFKVTPFFLHEGFEEAPYIELYCGEKVYEGYMKIEGGVSPKTKPFSLPLSSLKNFDLKRFMIIITHEEKVVYDSGESLYREFILLSDYGEISSRTVIPGSYYLYDPYNIEKITSDSGNVQSNGDRYTCSIIMEEGDALVGENSSVFFYDDIEEEEFRLVYKKEEKALFIKKDEEYEIIDGDLYVEMPASYEAKEFGIRYKEEFLHLEDFPFRQIADKKRYNITVIHDVGSPQSVSLFRFSQNASLAYRKIVKFNNIRISFDKDYYFGNQPEGVAHFKTDKYDFSKPFSILNKGSVDIPIGEGTIRIKPPIVSFALGEEEFRNTPIDKPIWYRKYHNGSILKASFPSSRNFRFFIEDEELLPDEGEYQFGRLLHYYAGISRGKTVTLHLDDGMRKFPVASFAIKPHLVNDELTVDTDEKKIHYSPSSFIGENSTRLTIVYSDAEGETLKEETFFSSEEKTFDLSTLPDGNYLIKITYKPNPFLEASICLYGPKRFGFGNFAKHLFEDRHIEVSRCSIIEPDGMNKTVPIGKFLVKDIVYLATASEGRSYYKGTICLENVGPNAPDPIVYKRELNPVLISTIAMNTCTINWGYTVIETGEFASRGRFVRNLNGHLSLPKKNGQYTQREIAFFIMEVKKNV